MNDDKNPPRIRMKRYRVVERLITSDFRKFESIVKIPKLHGIIA